MKRHFLVLLTFLLLFGAFASAQYVQVPTCDGYNGTTPVVTATGSTFCTDYFGVANWANSPLPAGSITGFTLVAGGSGYSGLTADVVVSDPTGPSLTIPGGATVTGGVVTAITGASAGGGYIMPQVTIVDPGPCPCGSGAMATAILGGPFTGGMLKFQDALPGLPIAVPDTITFPGSDYYVIALTDYQTTMHSSLPLTKVRGYVQLNNGTDANGQNTVLPPPQAYLGPVIIAQKNRPVRVLFMNKLATGQGGDLFIPVDPTYMGAKDTQNRATLHLHGGATPWISDGTPHQWTKPAGEAGSGYGASTTFVPDMWFDATSHQIVPAGTAGATNDPGPGNETFFWTNAQGGRLMFYHDHAYGITRLNVYAGEAAGYLLYDPTEESSLAAAGMPGSITAGDLSHLVPLVIQDKTFVPSAEQINATDPTWGGAGVAFGATPLALNATNPEGNGDLWFPHVYTPNQNPNDPVTGASGFGHWDYGAWFYPPQTTLSGLGQNGPVTVPCASSIAGGQTWQCPIIPNPSGTPEGFMDTPVINGKAYPVLNVNPEAYRFKILAAGNDRSWNLSWFVADSTQNNTEVAMLPAALPPASGLPLCTAINPVAVPSLVLGLATGLLDNSGNPMNGTGLPAGCWPNYGPQPGIPSAQTMWAADGRAGGAPDPRNAGPPWVEIGSEGGLLPAPVVIPATPINYEQNTRSITIGSVAIHGLWLGPAERADVIVDFSKFAGKTLILYNDAPAPAPAIDSRLDYFTGDGDQSPIGGAPNTQPGYGPNTRTIMQVVVGSAPSATGKTLNLPALKAAFASSATVSGLFAATQPTTIVPQPAYNSAYAGNFPTKNMGIQDTTMTFTPLPAANVQFEPLLLPAENLPQCSATAPAVCTGLSQKTIQELFTLDYGRMNATLGTELPLTSFANQTTIPLGYVDPATEIVRQGDTQLWKITHNGVDTHFIHFHLFNVQVINRVGWDGSIRPIDANEYGWKDTVRMNPLEDILVALQPITPPTPFPVPNSVRHNDVTGMNAFSNLDPFANAPFTTVDVATNFGWEYVWHCHILGHEENDMMRPIIWQVPPPAPSNLTAAFDGVIPGQVDLSFTDSSASETKFVIQRDTTSAFTNPVTLPDLPPSSPTNPAGEGYTWGGTITARDTPPLGSTFFYRVQAVDNGFTTGNEQSYNATSALSSGWSNVATAILLVPTTTFTGAPASAAYLSNFIVTATSTGTAIPAITVSGPCSATTLGGTASSYQAQVFMNSGSGSCVMTAAWPIGGGYAGATLQQTTAATKATPTTTFGGAPSTSPYNSNFTVTATTNASTVPTIIGTVGICSVGAVSGTAASAKATVTMTSGTGTCVLTATWLTDLNYAAALATQSTTATKLNSQTTITANTPNPSVAGQGVVVSYKVVSQTTLSGGATGPSGNVTVTANGSSCTGTVVAGSCVATIPNAGTYTITANYAGDANFNSSLSPGVTQQVRDFSVTVSPKSQSINGNQQAKYTVTITSLNNFSGSVAMSCGGTYPSSYSCTTIPTPVNVPAGGSVTTTVTVNTLKGSPGTYNVTATGKYGTGTPSSGGLTHSATATVTTKN